MWEFLFIFAAEICAYAQYYCKKSEKMDTNNQFVRGSEWRKWDLHIHTQASDGKGTCEAILAEAKNKGVSCLAVTDHHTFANVDAMKKLASAYGITIITGVEFRTEYGSESVHMIGLFPDEFEGTKLTADFLHDNILSPLGASRSAIIAKGRAENPSGDDDACFKAGMFKVQVDFKDAADLIHKFGGLVTVHAGNKGNSIEGMKHDGQGVRNTTIEYSLATLKEELFKEGYIDICDITKPKDAEFYLKEFGKPSITTSDAHELKEVGSNCCWIKADPTFYGLRQILVEPDRVSFEEPKLLTRIQQHPDKFISELTVCRTASATMPEVWFDNITLPFNPGMVVIIGNKGSGKSAIADILALCADARNKEMSFLTQNKFRMSKPYNRAKQIEAFIRWKNNLSSTIKTLDVSADDTQPERVKYIPQNFLENICTTEEDSKFEEELKNIIFQYLSPENRYDQQNMDAVIAYLTEENNKACKLIKEQLEELNKRIIALEAKLDTRYRPTLQNNLQYMQEQLSNAQTAKPQEIAPPSATTDAEAMQAKLHIDQLTSEVKALQTLLTEKQTLLAKKSKCVQDLTLAKEHFGRLKQQYENACTQYTSLLSENGLDIKSVLDLQYNQSVLDDKIRQITMEVAVIDAEINNEQTGIEKQIADKNAALLDAQKKLSEPERLYQEYLLKKQAWEKQIEEITGTPEKEGSIRYYQAQLEYVDHQLNTDLTQLRQDRRELLLQLMNKKAEVLTTYNTLFAPVVEFTKKYSSEMNDYPIEFDASFSLRKFGEQFFGYINQQSTGSFCGKEQGMARLLDLLDAVEPSNIESVVDFSIAINDCLLYDKRDPAAPITRNVENQFRRDYTQLDVYNYIYGLDYVVPFFQLKMNGKPLSSLSPGERGALLLLLYLFIDMDDKPMIIDQPEENLDNESVYRYLVKFIREAKKKRQIIIVTHNPNLAVVCDADQVIRMNIDKLNNKNVVTYVSGAIENPVINKQIVDVLEGTYPAFHNRDCKYIEKR